MDLINCIGCSACFDPCPVSVKNEFEEGLSERKAIYIPCNGTLPNVPAIDTKNCLRFTKGEDCQACKEACMFDAVDFNQRDEELELKVGAILVATGFSQYDPGNTPQYGYGKFSDVYTALELERMFASNGPTSGEIKLKNGEHPKSVAILHCVGRKEKGYCSTVCCMYSLKFVHYLKEKLPEVKIYELYSDLCIPGKSYQKFYEETKEKGVQIIRAGEVSVTEEGRGIIIKSTVNGKERSLSVDMVILSPAIEPREDAPRLAKVLDIPQDEHGFFREEPYAPVATPREGVFIAGCAQEPKDIQVSVAQSEAAVGRILATL